MDGHEDVKLEDEIQRIFACVVLKQKLSKEAIDKSKQLVINKLKSLVAHAYKKSLYRDPNSQQLETKDILSTVQEQGDIYKFKIARTIMVARTRTQASQGGDNLLKMSKSVKPGNYKVDDNEMSDE